MDGPNSVRRIDRENYHASDAPLSSGHPISHTLWASYPSFIVDSHSSETVNAELMVLLRCI